MRKQRRLQGPWTPGSTSDGPPVQRTPHSLQPHPCSVSPMASAFQPQIRLPVASESPAFCKSGANAPDLEMELLELSPHPSHSSILLQLAPRSGAWYFALPSP